MASPDSYGIGEGRFLQTAMGRPSGLGARPNLRFWIALRSPISHTSKWPAPTLSSIGGRGLRQRSLAYFCLSSYSCADILAWKAEAIVSPFLRSDWMAVSSTINGALMVGAQPHLPRPSERARPISMHPLQFGLSSSLHIMDIISAFRSPDLINEMKCRISAKESFNGFITL